MKAACTIAVVAASAVASLGLAADAIPPAGAKSLLEIVTNLEKSGYGPFVEASFGRSKWEVEVFKKGTACELHIDPVSGAMKEYHDSGDGPPVATDKPLSEILGIVASAGLTHVVDVSFENREWEVEGYRDGVKRELLVEPQTGRILSDRIDD